MVRVRSPREGDYYEERGASGTAEQLMAVERRLNLQKEQMKGKHGRVKSQEPGEECFQRQEGHQEGSQRLNSCC